MLYNHDLTSTLLSLANIAPKSPLDGMDFWPKVVSGDAHARDHVTIAWGTLVTVITDQWWYNANISGEGELLYSVREDPDLEHSLAGEKPQVCKQLLALAIEDAGGEIPEAFSSYNERPGCTPFGDTKNYLEALKLL